MTFFVNPIRFLKNNDYKLIVKKIGIPQMSMTQIAIHIQIFL